MCFFNFLSSWTDRRQKELAVIVVSSDKLLKMGLKNLIAFLVQKIQNRKIEKFK